MVMGSNFGTTVWRGSAFDCATGEISLPHALYSSTVSYLRLSGECNNGSIVAQGLETENGTKFTSQLNISVSAKVIGRNIDCFYDDANNNTKLVGSRTISTSGKDS